jgi:hypothetical protein
MESVKPKYKAYLYLGRKVWQVRYIFGDIPETQEFANKTLKLKMVLWNCNNKATLDKYKFVEIQALIYR